ncbi:MAG: mechanosensitive ion channel, partial [Planctomycetales bacterium]|nr:mechanosensitive ion channel [Planctomycetales bacterium]
TETQKQWAEKTAMRTSDVVAVVNHITLRKRPLFDWQPATDSLRSMLQGFLSKLPLFLVALIVVLIGYFIANLAGRIAARVYADQDSKLLRQVVASVVWAIVFLVGLFVALRISNLTELASTLLGGTGLVGLALGFAFRDIAENFLSSLLLSVHSPFGVGDLIEVDGTTGYVRKVTTRATVLATFDGSQVQIPNSTIYKGKITNYTATPLRRQNFKIGIGYHDSASDAQELIMQVLRDHPAVENEPAPAVVVESLGSSTVNLNCLYWFNQREHSGLRVGSALIRRTKQSLMDANISLPDEARELVFPASVPIQILSADDPRTSEVVPDDKVSESHHTTGEGDLHSEDADVQQAMGDESVGDSIV